MTWHDPYGPDVLADHRASLERTRPAQLAAERGLVIEETQTGFSGAIVAREGSLVTLEDYFGTRRVFPLGAGYLHEGVPVELVAPRAAPTAPLRSASGSIHAGSVAARVARASRILVEGRHDAELVEKVWGHDLRVEGVVVEYLEGIDRLESTLRDIAPGPERRIGVLVDHLVAGSKESRMAEALRSGPHAPHVLIVGHPYVDVWQAVKPARLGLSRWPEIPRGTDWKRGVCAALGWPHAEQADIARAWERILGSVRTYADLEPALLGPVEELIDFVTADWAAADPS